MFDDRAQCRACGVSFVGEDIAEALLNNGTAKTRQEAEEKAAFYGWSPETPKTFVINCVLVKDHWGQIPSYMQCKVCGAKQ